MQNKFIFLFDGGCPFCLRETRFLRNKDVSNKINFVDINNFHNYLLHSELQSFSIFDLPVILSLYFAQYW